MDTKLGEKYDLTFAGKPPGMSPQDFLLWLNYRKTIDKACFSIYFNVYLGKGVDAGDEFDEKWKDYWMRMTQLRADAVLEYKNKIVIVELRHHAEVDVVGRLLAYMNCMKEDNPFGKEISGEVVTNKYADVVDMMCASHGLSYVVI